jgi:DNA-directed RNA polymerase subunit RPC12/RpoP
MVKCGVCGADVKEQPKITSEGKCSICGAKLTVKK